MDSGILNKKVELSVILSDKNPDIVIFNEILPKKRRLKKKLSNKDFKLDGYECMIRSTTEGRGVVIYFKEFLNVQSVEVLNKFDFEECIWLRIQLKGSDSLLIGCIYRSPSSSRENNIKLNVLLRQAVSLKDTHVLFVGDFNYGGLDWELEQSSENIDHCSTLFMDNIKDLFLYQHVTECTRHRVGQSSARLDLIFSNEYDMITDLDYLPPIGASDHICLAFKFMCYTDNKPSQVPRLNFYKGDYSSIRANLQQVRWDEIQDSDMTLYWNNFVDILNNNIENHIPKIKPSSKAKKKPWLNRDSLNAIQDKKQAWKKYCLCKTKYNFQLYSEKRNKATRACRNAKINFEKQIADNIKTDTKSFWNYVRSQSKTRTGISDLQTDDGTLLTSDVQKAEILNSFFSSVFTDEDISIIPSLDVRSFDECLDSINITPEIVKKKLDKLKTNKAAGVDNIHPLLLKECAIEISSIVTNIFNMSIKESTLPDVWKKAQVSPIFKKGNKHLCSNYRPVSLTAILCKLLESFVRDASMQHMRKNQLFTIHQHGYGSKHSSVTQLLEVVEHWSDILEKGGAIDCIYLDIAKAFDTVPYKRLLQKLYAYGIR